MDVISKWVRLLLGNPQLVILVLTLVLGFGAILWIGNLVAPIIASVIIAYLLDGFANPLTRIRIPRFIGVLIVYLGFLALLAFIVFAIVPILSQQATQLVSQIPGIFTELRDALMQLPHRYPEFISESQVNQVAGAIGYEAMALGRGMLTASVSSVFGVITLGIYVVLMPLLVFFMLKDKERLIAWVIGFLPRDHRLLAHVWEDVHRQLGNYVRGKIIEIIVVWVATYFTFAVFGLDFAVLLSFLVGISVLIPYVGAIAVTIPVAMIAYVQWGIGPDFAYLMLAYLVVQVLDGNVLVPLLFSEVVNMHPIAIIASVLVFGGLWGFWGVFFAIPLGILIQCVLHAWPRREQIIEETS